MARFEVLIRYSYAPMNPATYTVSFTDELIAGLVEKDMTPAEFRDQIAGLFGKFAVHTYLTLDCDQGKIGINPANVAGIEVSKLIED